MRIGEVARQSGVGVETVRFYERKGLVARPLRPSSGGYRDYPVEVVRRIGFIRSAQNLGFSLTEIAELLELESGAAAQCADVLERARTKRREVLAKIDDLNRINKALDILIGGCPREGPAHDCSILQAINNGDLRLKPTTKGQRDGRH